MVASLMTFPEYGIVVAVTSNISYADTFSLAVKIAEAFAEQGEKSSTQVNPIQRIRSLSLSPAGAHGFPRVQLSR